MSTTINSESHTVEVVSLGFRGECEFIHNGEKRRILGSNLQHSTAEKLRANAARSIEDAQRDLRSAALALELADIVEFVEAERAEQARTQRREKAAATRAHNADPWGHKARAAARS